MTSASASRVIGWTQFTQCCAGERARSSGRAWPWPPRCVSMRFASPRNGTFESMGRIAAVSGALPRTDFAPSTVVGRARSGGAIPPRAALPARPSPLPLARGVAFSRVRRPMVGPGPAPPRAGGAGRIGSPVLQVVRFGGLHVLAGRSQPPVRPRCVGAKRQGARRRFRPQRDRSPRLGVADDLFRSHRPRTERGGRARDARRILAPETARQHAAHVAPLALPRRHLWPRPRGWLSRA